MSSKIVCRVISSCIELLFILFMNLNRKKSFGFYSLVLIRVCVYCSRLKKARESALHISCTKSLWSDVKHTNMLDKEKKRHFIRIDNEWTNVSVKAQSSEPFYRIRLSIRTKHRGRIERTIDERFLHEWNIYEIIMNTLWAKSFRKSRSSREM